jgi:hypothetical protein
MFGPSPPLSIGVAFPLNVTVKGTFGRGLVVENATAKVFVFAVAKVV